MRGRDTIGAELLRDRIQCPVSHDARGFLPRRSRAARVSFALGFDIDANHVAGVPQRARLGLHGLLVRFGFLTPQTVIDVRNLDVKGEIGRDGRERVQQDARIDPARNGNQNRLPCEFEACDRFGNGL